MTPFEFNQHSLGYAERMRDMSDIGRSMSWTVAALGRVKKMPEYEAWMSQNRKPLSDDDRQEMIEDRDTITAEFQQLFDASEAKKKEDRDNQDSAGVEE